MQQDKEHQYFKFVSALIDSGIWAGMSAAARALYPVLLRFSDRHYKEVWPGTQALLKLTGFKQKASLRKARQELVGLGLITLAQGSGRKNTRYHFHFDWVTGGPPSGVSARPAEGTECVPGGALGTAAGVVPGTPRYNQIHISINNTQNPEAQNRASGKFEAGTPAELAGLKARHGHEAVRLALSECELSGLPPSAGNIQKILYRGDAPQGESWSDVEEFLASRISPGSLKMIRESLIEERDGVLVFQDSLPEYLKQLLRRFDHRLFFEPMPATSRREFWRTAQSRI